jgi:flagellin
VVNSINTNIGAMIALQALNASSSSLQKTENEISTGLTVSSPADNGATWSIAQGVRSQVSDYRAVSNDLSNGQSLVDAAVMGSEQIANLLSELKANFLALNDTASDPANQNDLTSNLRSLINQINNVANTSNFNGIQPLLPSTTRVVTTSTVLGVQQLYDPATIDITPSSFSAVTGYEIEGSKTFSVNGGASAGVATLSLSLGVDPDLVQIYQNGDLVAATGDVPVSIGTPVSGDTSLSFNYDPANGQSIQVEVDNGLTLPGDWTINGFTLSAPNPDAGQPDGTEPIYNFKQVTTPNDYNFLSSPNGDKITVPVTGLDSGSLYLSDIDWNDPKPGTISIINAAIATADNAAAYYGNLQNAFTSAQTQASNMQGALTTGIGNLVDADVAADSAQLTAEQTKQQLAAQSLSIANQFPASLLTLFKR